MLRRLMIAGAGSAVGGLTFDPLRKHSSITLTAGDRTAIGSANSGGQVLAKNPKSSGKWYLEALVDSYAIGSGSNGIGVIGLSTDAAPLSDYLGKSPSCCGVWGVGSSTAAYLSGATASPGPVLGSVSGGDVFGMAWDADTGKVWYSKNGSWSGNPSAGTAPTHSSTSLTGLHYAASGPRNIGNSVTLSSSPAFPVPSGFTVWGAL